LLDDAADLLDDAADLLDDAAPHHAAPRRAVLLLEDTAPRFCSTTAAPWISPDDDVAPQISPDDDAAVRSRQRRPAGSGATDRDPIAFNFFV
jgi:hypothetical protein